MAVLDLGFLASLYWPGFGHGSFLAHRKANAEARTDTNADAGSCTSSRRHLQRDRHMPSNGQARRVWRWSRTPAVVVLAVLALLAAGCSKMNQLKGMKNFKEANAAYQQQDYKKAADLYEQTVGADPNISSAYFYLGNSYDNLYKPSKKGEQANDELLEKAVKNYQTAAEKLSSAPTKTEKDLGKLSLKYLVAS
jgi:tetratricopeptide (TPR) repeat protein